ncbi:hypothetical protein EVAR_53999_1 [Eumeta japonica]|uniref:Uncharacterized protein n=1 Tax=Eumeta variegata TaxID=151549 RepID=A0A4C1YTL4_EUMVA|nr:hypothetical protein EVAR_53999_1 [Eumeta japonica]
MNNSGISPEQNSNFDDSNVPTHRGLPDSRELKWRWTGRMTRDSRIKWTKILTEWQPRDGTRKRGRQAKRWMDDIRKIGEATWSRKARDREEWKRLEEAYVS